MVVAALAAAMLRALPLRLLKERSNFMDTSSATTAPARLYALLLKLRPVERGTIMPFSGDLVHGAWLDWIKSAAPEVATMLHDGNKRRLFTCSSLQFPIAEPRMRQAEWNNVHLPLDPEKTYTVRVTLLLGELFALFYDSIMRFNMTAFGSKQQPFLRIGKQSLLLEQVIADPKDSAGWSGFTSFADLVEQAKTWKPGNPGPLTLEFASLTTFNRINPINKIYGNYYARLPLPQYIFPGLARRWQELAPPELATFVHKEQVEQYIQDEGIIIEDYHLQAHCVSFVSHPQKGFTGTCKYNLRGPDSATTPETALTVRQQLRLLAGLAFYTGVGYKTAMGMGQVRLV
jgi:CRISPR-associated endoribonuclease Cas6